MKILISVGREVGGVTSFSKSLGEGFEELGYEVIYFKITDIFKYKKELLDKKNLKILSTTSVFIAPFLKNSICVAHGFPRINGQGFIKWLIITISFYLANKFSKLCTVSYYVKNHLKAFYNISNTFTIYNPLRKEFIEHKKELIKKNERKYITYIGRLHEVKNLESFIYPLIKLLGIYDLNNEYKVLFIGHGKEKSKLINLMGLYENKFEFYENLETNEIIEILNNTKVFFSGCETEALGISFLEALSLNANIVMPLSGGGIEIEPLLLEKGVFCFHPSFEKESIYQALEKAFLYKDFYSFDISKFKSKNIAFQYLLHYKNKI